MHLAEPARPVPSTKTVALRPGCSAGCSPRLRETRRRHQCLEIALDVEEVDVARPAPHCSGGAPP